MVSIRDQERTRKKILDLTAQLWKEQGNIELDQVDGTFYFHICRVEDIRRIIDKAESPRYHPRHTDEHLKSLMPGYQDRVFEGQRPHIPERPSLRSAADFSAILYGGRVSADGTMIEREQHKHAGLGWIRLGIRNRDWSGKRVEEAFRAHPGVSEAGITKMPNPPYQDNEAIAIIGAKLYRGGEYGHKLYWNPEQEDPDSPPMFWNDDDELRIRVDLSEPGWEVIPWGPMVVVSVAEPLPAKGAIEAFYDADVIRERRWHEELLGGSNGQDVATAIRTWATALLIKTEMSHGVAIGHLHYFSNAIPEDKLVSETKYRRDLEKLLRRAPEARESLK